MSILIASTLRDEVGGDRGRQGVSGLIIESKNFTPLMWITVGLLLLGVILLVWAWRMTLRKNQECRDCGYDLTGIPKDATRCPECGGDLAVCVLTPERSITAGRRLRSRGIGCLAAGLLAGVGLTLVHPWRIPLTPTWVLTNIDLPVIRWRGTESTQAYAPHFRVWDELNSRLIRYDAATPRVELADAPALTRPEMQVLLEGFFEEIAREGIAKVSRMHRPEVNLWEAAMHAGWWSPEEVGALIGTIPPIGAMSLDHLSVSDAPEVMSLTLSSGDPTFFSLEVQFSALVLDIDDRTLRLAELPNHRGASQPPPRQVFGFHDLVGTSGQSTIFTKHASESKGTLRCRLVLVSRSRGTPLASQWMSAPVEQLSVSPTQVAVASGDAVEAIGRDLSEASVFISDPGGGEGGRIVIATTNAEWAEAARRDGQALDLVCPLRSSTSRIRKHDRFVTEPSTRELAPLADGRRRFTLREFEYEDAKALGPGTVRFGLDSMTWHDILAASEDTDPDWDPRRESRLIPFTVSIPSAAPIVTSAPDETP